MEQLVARRAHNPKVVGSSPTPATNNLKSLIVFEVFLLLIHTALLISHDNYDLL